ncbi:MAG: hypothetical protein M1828_001657 [Chrysothrix sp. TS-e1954]|nr:MAG: hypothetical protein M1828_001657 [Chrysothrix sp. TS-e1954]
MDPSTSGPKSGIPRRFSKLPTPRSTQSTEPPVSFIPSKQGSYSNGSPAELHQEPAQAATTSIAAGRSIQTPSKPRPLSYLSSPIKQHGSSYKRPISGEKQATSAYGTAVRPSSRSKPQTPLTGDNVKNETYDSEASPERSPLSEDTSEGSGPSITRAKRGSLSERTVESLSQVPPSPASARRRSSFFTQPAQTTTPHRPTSSVNGGKSVSKLNYGTLNGGFARPASPVKKPVGTTMTNSTSRRSASNSQATTMRPPAAATTKAIPRPPSAASSNTALPRPPSANKSRPASTIMQKGNTISGRPTKAMLSSAGATAPEPRAPPTSFTRPTPALANAKPRPAVKKSTASVAAQVEQSNDNDKTPAKSSVALRQQLAQARAAHRKAATKPKYDYDPNNEVNAVDLDDIEDPFNQAPKDGKNLLRRRIDQARQDGRLNISAMNLKTLPEEVLQMYDSASMEASSVPWNETVDLTRFVAADNLLTELGEDAFPDKSAEALANDDDPDARGSQFAGIETLDLHNNHLTSIPTGLRQLSRLVTLNLSRNKLDNWAFDIIVQLPQLEHLYLTDNTIAQELPESIGRLTSLETLDLHSNRIVSLPRSLDQLTSLRSLNLSVNRLSSLPFDAFARLPHLSSLQASQNAITGALFPSTITSLSSMSVLDVSNNAIASLLFGPGTIALPNLTRLDVSRNRLGSFPDMSSWTNLTTLMAEENALGTMPRGMTALKDSLRTVVLSRNELRTIDEDIVDMKALETLELSQNPIRERKLLGMDAQAVKRELERRREMSAVVA